MKKLSQPQILYYILNKFLFIGILFPINHIKEKQSSPQAWG